MNSSYMLWYVLWVSAGIITAWFGTLVRLLSLVDSFDMNLHYILGSGSIRAVRAFMSVGLLMYARHVNIE